MNTNFPFPKPEYIRHLREFYERINGEESFAPPRQYTGENWSATVDCSRGDILAKAGFAWLELNQGLMNEEKGADIRLFETLAHPVHPCTPGFIIMTNMNESPSAGRMIVLYADLIIMDQKPHDEDTRIFAQEISAICTKYNHDYEEYRSFTASHELLGGHSACCGFLNFFMEDDVDFLDAMIRTSISAYGKVLQQQNRPSPQEEDFAAANAARARMIDWILSRDYGIKLARENHIPIEMIEAYGFPPVVKY